MHIADQVYLEGHKIDFTKLDVVGRLAGSSYTHVRDLFDLKRPSYEDVKETTAS